MELDAVRAKGKEKNVRIRFPHAKAVFDHIAELGYSKVSRDHGYGAVVDWIRAQCGPWRGRSISLLDVGCADGQVGSVFVDAGVAGQFTGVDFSERMLDACRAAGTYERLVQGDLNFGLPDLGHARFDVATMCGVLEFVEDATRVLSDVRSVAKPGMELLVTFETPPLADGHPPAPDWKFFRTAAQATELLAATGYQLTSLEQRVAFQQVAGNADGTLRSLGVDVEYVFVRARAG